MPVRTPDPDGLPDDSVPRLEPVWLSDSDLARARRQLPLLYVEGLPVRTDSLGTVVEVGLLLRVSPLGAITRTLVSGRVMFGETIREALFRHIEKDLGPMAFPQMPLSPTPFHVAEYFPLPGVTPFVDDRQHAVSLAYMIPVTGTCDPRQDALELTWMTPAEAVSSDVLADMEGGRGLLVRAALASAGVLP